MSEATQIELGTILNTFVLDADGNPTEYRTVRVNDIAIEDGFNQRLSMRDHHIADLSEDIYPTKASMDSRGQRKPIEVIVGEDGEYILHDGEHRVRAALAAQERHGKEAWLQFVTKSFKTPKARFLDHAKSNKDDMREEWSDAELGSIFDKIQKDFGMSQK